MKTSVDDRVRAEIARFSLRFCCEDCAHFDDERERCEHGYPTEPHRRRPLGESLLFCKHFELT